jgi:hypothetical protein
LLKSPQAVVDRLLMNIPEVPCFEWKSASEMIDSCLNRRHFSAGRRSFADPLFLLNPVASRQLGAIMLFLRAMLDAPAL